MKTLSLRHLLGCAVLATASSAIWAQSPTPAAPGGHARPSYEGMTHDRMHAHRMEKQARALEQLKSRLQLQAAQEGAWSRFVTAIQPPAKPLARPDHAAMEKMTTPERMERMQSFRAERDAIMQKRIEATRTFYDGLSSEQKKVFDEEARHWMKERSGRHGMHPAGMPR
jgi:protein CpxP